MAMLLYSEQGEEEFEPSVTCSLDEKIADDDNEEAEKASLTSSRMSTRNPKGNAVTESEAKQDLKTIKDESCDGQKQFNATKEENPVHSSNSFTISMSSDCTDRDTDDDKEDDSYVQKHPEKESESFAPNSSLKLERKTENENQMDSSLIAIVNKPVTANEDRKGGDKLKRKRSENTESFDSPMSSNDSNAENQPKKKRTKANCHSKRDSTKESSKIIKLKRYLSIAGIKVRNYATFFEGCKSKKSKEMKLLKLLEDNGLKGKPTIEKCKKLRKKREVEQEISELDFTNIIQLKEDADLKRVPRTRNRLKTFENLDYNKEPLPVDKKGLFGNLVGIIDSEESDVDCRYQDEKQRVKKKHVIESEEESVSC